MVVLRNRAHLFAHPRHKDALHTFFTEILGCTAQPAPVSLPEDIVAFTFADGSSVSVEFTEKATDALDEQEVRRGAWLELETEDRGVLQQRIRAAGYPRFEYTPGYFYFQIPGGQVMHLRS